MTARTARVLTTDLVSPANPFTADDSAFTSLHGFLIAFDHNGVVVTSATDTLDVDVSAVLAAAKRNGKTYALKFVALAQGAIAVTTAGVRTALSATVTITGTTARLTPKAASDGTTDAGIGATDVLQRPFKIFVAVHESGTLT